MGIRKRGQGTGQCKLLKEKYSSEEFFSPPCIFTLKIIRIFWKLFLPYRNFAKIKIVQRIPVFPVLRLAMVHFFSEPLRVRGIHHSPLCLNT